MRFVPERWKAGRPSFLIAFALLALLVAACSDSDDPTVTVAATTVPDATESATAEPTGTAEATPTDSPSPIVVADSDGFEVELEGPAQRIISYSPGVTEILFAIGAGDQVVAADEFSDYPAEAADLEKVSYSEPDPERALVLNPDLVIITGRQQQSVEQFRSLGLTVLFNVEPASVEAVLENIALLGVVAGHEDDAADLATTMRGRIAAVEDALSVVEAGPRVFYELSDGLYTVAPASFVGDTLRLVKAQNIAEGAETAFPQLTAEAVIEANPEVVLLADAEFGGSLEALRERPGWDVIDAVVNERVYPVDPDIGNRPGPRIVDAIEQIAELLYPELFG